MCMLSFHKVVPEVSSYYNNSDHYALLGGFSWMWGFGFVLFVLVWLFFFFLRGEVGAGAMGWWHVEWGFLSPVLSKLSSGQDDSPCKLPFLSYSKGTDLATNIHPPTIMTPQQANMVCPEQYSRQGEKTPEAKNAFCFQEYRACTGKQTG